MLRKLTAALLAAAGLAFAAQAMAAGGPYLADRHVARGATCESCHGVKTPALGSRVKTEKCLACHGSYEKVAQKTAAMKMNPHDSHLGEVKCTACHKGHQKPVLMCNDCHKFDMQPK